MRYNHFEAQAGNDMCDRIVCMLKESIRRYCNEGHYIVSADGVSVHSPGTELDP